MKRLFTKFGVTLGAIFLSLVTANTASATTTVGGLNFDDDAFADILINSSGNFNISGGTLSDVLTDNDAGTFAFSFTPGASVELGFVDNLLINGVGADLAIFELGFPDSFEVSVTAGGLTKSFLSQSTNVFENGFQLNVAKIDLDDFGIASGTTLSSVLIGLDTVSSSGTVPSLSLVGALNSVSPAASVPEPASTAAILAMAAVASGKLLKRKQST